jgi:hypothetical protein
MELGAELLKPFAEQLPTIYNAVKIYPTCFSMSDSQKIYEELDKISNYNNLVKDLKWLYEEITVKTTATDLDRARNMIHEGFHMRAAQAAFSKNKGLEQLGRFEDAYGKAKHNPGFLFSLIKEIETYLKDHSTDFYEYTAKELNELILKIKDRIRKLGGKELLNEDVNAASIAGFKDDTEYTDKKNKYEIYEKALREFLTKNKTNGISHEDNIKLPYADEINNDLRSKIETYEFIVNDPVKYFIYVDEKDKTVTTWTGQKLGDITKMGNEYNSAFGDTRVKIWVKAVNGSNYFGTYYKSAGDYATIKKLKMNIPDKNDD